MWSSLYQMWSKGHWKCFGIFSWVPQVHSIGYRKRKIHRSVFWWAQGAKILLYIYFFFISSSIESKEIVFDSLKWPIPWRTTSSRKFNCRKTASRICENRNFFFWSEVILQRWRKKKKSFSQTTQNKKCIDEKRMEETKQQQKSYDRYILKSCFSPFLENRRTFIDLLLFWRYLAIFTTLLQQKWNASLCLSLPLGPVCVYSKWHKNKLSITHSIYAQANEQKKTNQLTHTDT